MTHDHSHGHDHGHDHDHDHDHSHGSNSNAIVGVGDIVDWLASKRTTLWGTWAIDDDKGKEQAAQWFYKEVESLIHFTLKSRQQTSG